MIRTKKEDEGTVLFRKIGRGTTLLVIGGKKRRIKFNQRFRALPEEIPEGFRDTILPVDTEAEAPTKPSVAEVKSKEYFIKHKGSGWYDVVDADGKVQNEKNLRKVQAEEYKSSLT